MKVTRILHASVNTAPAGEDAARFYGDVLGLTPAERPDLGIPGQWFSVGDAQLHLIGFPSSAGAAVDPTRHHVCLGVEDLDAAVAVLEAAGIAVVRTAQHTPSGPVEQVFCTDPCGNTIELQRDAT